MTRDAINQLMPTALEMLKLGGHNPSAEFPESILKLLEKNAVHPKDLYGHYDARVLRILFKEKLDCTPSDFMNRWRFLRMITEGQSVWARLLGTEHRTAIKSYRFLYSKHIDEYRQANLRL